MKKFLKPKLIFTLVVVAMLFGVAAIQSMKVPAMASTSCGQILVKASDWLSGHGVAVRSNGADMNTGNECDPDGEVYNLSANPPQYGFGWVCVELVNRLYVTKGWSARLTIPATYNGQKTYEGAKWLYTLAAASYYPKLVAHANGSNYKPVPGDMIVHSNGKYGHVTVVDHISGNTLYAVDQNRSANGWESYTYNSSTGAVSMSGVTISGYVHSTKNKITLTDLGANFYGPFGISSSGIVSGNVPFNSAYWSSRPAIWQSGIITNLAIPSGSGGYGAAYGISPSGETVGSVADATSNNPNADAAKWNTSGSLTDLGSSSSTDATCNNGYAANAANSYGDIAGYCVEGGVYKAGYWPGGAPNSFTKLLDVSNGQGVSSVSGINRSGHMVGYAEVYDITVGPTSHPTYWHDGTVTDLAPAGSYEDYANAINDNELIVGSVDFTDSASVYTVHPYAWDKAANTTYDLYTLTGFEGVAKAVNNFGTVVGSIIVSNNPGNHAFMWQKGSSSIIDLNNLLPANSGWVLESADAINTNGQIVGTGLYNGEPHAYLLNTSALSGTSMSYSAG